MNLKATPLTERIIYRTKPHWIYLVRPALLVAIGLTCGCCTGILAIPPSDPGQEPIPSEIIGSFAGCSGCILGLALILIIFVSFYFITNEYVVTNRRVIQKTEWQCQNNYGTIYETDRWCFSPPICFGKSIRVW